MSLAFAFILYAAPIVREYTFDSQNFRNSKLPLQAHCSPHSVPWLGCPWLESHQTLLAPQSASFVLPGSSASMSRLCPSSLPYASISAPWPPGVCCLLSLARPRRQRQRLFSHSLFPAPAATDIRPVPSVSWCVPSCPAPGFSRVPLNNRPAGGRAPATCRSGLTCHLEDKRTNLTPVLCRTDSCG